MGKEKKWKVVFMHETEHIKRGRDLRSGSKCHQLNIQIAIGAHR